MTTLRIKKQTFLADLKTCLTVKKRIDSNLFLCEYITPALEKREVTITTI